MIEIDGISKRFTGRHGEVQALQDLDLSVRDNEFLTILGPSGCGKTTLLRMIAGLVPADRRRGSGRRARPSESPAVPTCAIVFQRLRPPAVGNGSVERRALASTSRGPPRLARPDEGSASDRVRRPEGLRADCFLTSCRVACANGSAWRGRWPSSLEVLLMDEPFSALDAQTSDSSRRSCSASGRRREPP